MIREIKFDSELLLGEGTKELERRLGTMFHAVDGPPRAFFELGHGDKIEDRFRVIYVTVAYGCFGSLPAQTMERQLCERIYSDILAAVGDEEKDTTSMILFWRKRPHVYVMAAGPGQLRAVVRMRLAIPNLDLSKLKTFKMESDPLFFEKVD